jgi:hypothetical protein
MCHLWQVFVQKLRDKALHTLNQGETAQNEQNDQAHLASETKERTSRRRGNNATTIWFQFSFSFRILMLLLFFFCQDEERRIIDLTNIE